MSMRGRSFFANYLDGYSEETDTAHSACVRVREKRLIQGTTHVVRVTAKRRIQDITLA